MKSIVAVLFILAVTSGQPPAPPGPDQSLMSRQSERFELMKMWKLTDVLGLSEEQAQKFFPRHNSLVDGLEELSEQQKELMSGLHEAVDEGKTVTDKDVNGVMKKVLDMERMKLNQKQDFVENLGDILTPEQKAKYVVFEVRFREHLLRQIREQRGMKREGHYSPRKGRKRGQGK
ncbi:MAG: hypothetical protein V3U24_09540 [Candidatus Neomarinimicrobiota bacterium]